MHLPGIFQLMLIVLVILIFFGAGKLPNVMSEIGKGIKNLRDGMREGEGNTPEPRQTAETQALPPAGQSPESPAAPQVRNKDDASV